MAAKAARTRGAGVPCTGSRIPRVGRLEGKVALVTGAADGMGRAAARLFAAEGARVGVLDVNAEGAEAVAAEIREAALPLAADVSRSAEVEQAVEALVARFGGLHVLYNNAGVWLPGDGPVTELDEAAWERTLAVNLNGVFYCCRHGIPHLVRAGGGSVINTSSPVAIRPEPVYDAYTASKGAVISLTRSIAQSYARQGVRANVLMPGTIATPMTLPALQQDSGYADFARRMTVLGRFGTPEEVARVALFLASDESSYVTGAIQWVDGGWMLGPLPDTSFGAV